MVSIAEKLAKEQKEISIAEFFEKNKQILGFDSLTKALITVVKEGVDNSLDACEEARILPDILVEMRELDRGEFKVIIEDNGPGIVKRQIPNVFGRLLYGSRFHSIRQSRGQQGIGISAVVMYAQLTTGKMSRIISKTKNQEVAHEVKLTINIKRNRPDVHHDDFFMWEGKEHGTRFECQVKARYITGKQSVLEYLKATAIVNPHAQITFKDPTGETLTLHRVSEELPHETKEVKPHPQGIELGHFLTMAKETKSRKLSAFLQNEFSRVSSRVAKEICEKAEVPETRSPARLKNEEARAILTAVNKVKIMSPQTDCLSPIGDRLIRMGLRNVLDGLRPGYYARPVTRDPKVWSGHPFQVEVGIVHGGQLPKDQQVEILRFANRVPLLYLQGADVITKAISNVDWRRYGLEQRGGKGIPFGPAIILVHVASTQIPFTSEAKDAIANLEVIREEIERALRLCARQLKTHIGKSARRKKTREKFDIVQVLIPEIAKKAAGITGKPMPKLGKTVTSIMNVVWIDNSVEYVNRRYKARVDVYNYTNRSRKLNLHVVVPGKKLDQKRIEPPPKEVNGDKVTWSLNTIPSVEMEHVTFELGGMAEGEFDSFDIYVSDINPTLVIGAEPLPGDWDLDETTQPSLMEFEDDIDDEADEPEEPDDENGVDYDEETEEIPDEDEEGD